MKFPKAKVEVKSDASASPIDGFENEFDEMSNDAKYWFTAQKMGQF